MVIAPWLRSRDTLPSWINGISLAPSIQLEAGWLSWPSATNSTSLDGWPMSGWCVFVQFFDLETCECSTIPSSGLNRQLFPAVALNDSIFILGGNRMKEVAVYDPETFTSTKAESMKFRGIHQVPRVVGGKIYVTGGELRQHVAKVEAYDPYLDLWDILKPMPHAVCFHGCVMIRKYLGPPYQTWIPIIFLNEGLLTTSYNCFNLWHNLYIIGW